MMVTSEQSTAILSIRGLSKFLGKSPILQGISLDVYPGEIYGFLGPNGSGKTTTIKLILGLLRLEEGTITICGHSIADNFEKAISCVGGIIENPEMYKYLTGRENLEQYARMCDGVTSERIDEVVRLVGLEARIGDKIGRYSLGMRQRLGVAQALLHRPKLLVLDEPTNGLDPAGIKELRDILKEVCRKEGAAVFISSHLLSELEQTCDRVGVIDRGRMVGERSMHEVQTAFEDGKEHFLAEVGNAEGALTVLREAGVSCERAEQGIDLVSERANIPSLVRLLVSAEIDVYGLSAVRRSLESAFLEMVGDSKDVGLGVSLEEPSTGEDINAEEKEARG